MLSKKVKWRIAMNRARKTFIGPEGRAEWKETESILVNEGLLTRLFGAFDRMDRSMDAAVFEIQKLTGQSLPIPNPPTSPQET